MILVLDHPQFRKNLDKWNLSGKARGTLVLDHASNTGLLKPLLVHLDFDQVLRDEELFIEFFSNLLYPCKHRLNTRPLSSLPQLCLNLIPKVLQPENRIVEVGVCLTLNEHEDTSEQFAERKVI